MKSLAFLFLFVFLFVFFDESFNLFFLSIVFIANYVVLLQYLFKPNGFDRCINNIVHTDFIRIHFDRTFL